MLLPLNLWESAVAAEDRTENEAAHSTSNSKKSSLGKHANRDAGSGQKKLRETAIRSTKAGIRILGAARNATEKL